MTKSNVICFKTAHDKKLRQKALEITDEIQHKYLKYEHAYALTGDYRYLQVMAEIRSKLEAIAKEAKNEGAR